MSRMDVKEASANCDRRYLKPSQEGDDCPKDAASTHENSEAAELAFNPAWSAATSARCLRR